MSRVDLTAMLARGSQPDPGIAASYNSFPDPNVKCCGRLNLQRSECLLSGWGRLFSNVHEFGKVSFREYLNFGAFRNQCFHLPMFVALFVAI